MALIIGVTLAIGAYMAWNIGANDVANAMGTSVGSRAINLKTAMIVAAIANFAGAFLVGPRVTSTIRGKIVEPDFFANNMEMFVIGMLAALLASAIWLHVATYLGWPVSTTHAIVGAVLGFGLATKGVHSIHWIIIIKIVSSWIISPFFGALFSSLIFMVILRSILFSAYPLKAAKKWVPWIVAGAIVILVFSLFFESLEHLHLDFKRWQTALIALGAGIVAYSITRLAMQSISLTDELSSRSQKFKVVEKIFAKMQLASACYVAFAHGANDVANAIGPVAAVVDVAKKGYIDASAPVEKWLLLFGGVFIGVGTCTWGYRVIKTVGENITGISPSRGFAAEFGCATTVLICSQMGLPISTTHCIVGSVIGVGFARGMRALNLQVIRRVFESWFYTIPFAAMLTFILYKLIRLILQTI